MTVRWYKLDEHKRPVPCDVQEAERVLTGHKIIETADGRRQLKVGANVQRVSVLRYKTPFFIEEVRTSTTFLALDHSLGDGEPVLFETMVFGGVNNGYQERYTSYELAMAGHRRIAAQQLADNSFWRLLLKRTKDAWRRWRESL